MGYTKHSTGRQPIAIFHPENRLRNFPKMIKLEDMSRYVSPVNPNVYPHLALVLMCIGLFFTAWFFVYEVTSTKFTREIMKEVLISIIASIFMGMGTLYLMLWVGIYV